LADLGRIFKAYDIRGLVPSELDEARASSIGAAFGRLIERRTEGEVPAKAVIVGHDMRTSSPAMARSFAEGVLDMGRDVMFIGLAATDQLYFGSGSLAAPAAMVTASHNPAEYNGFKLCLPGAVALSAANGLDEIQDDIRGAADPRSPATPGRGALSEADLLPAYVRHLHQTAPVRGRRLRVVVDAANGMAGLTAPAVLGPLDIELIPLYFELDGTFPNHEANPLVPANLRDLRAAVVAEEADLGLAFDGDADRCFVIDELGRPVSPSAVTSLIAARELTKHPGASVIHNLITSRAVPELITARGGTPIRTPVGHSLIKAEMARTGAVFGGEHSGHYYFKDFWYADSGMLAALQVLATLAEDHRPISQITAAMSPYVASGEINLAVESPATAMASVERRFAERPDLTVDRLDGLSVIGEDWWLNVRASNTEPLLRLNVEARDEATMVTVRDSTLALLAG